MDDRSYLHDGERLLLKMSPGTPVLLRGIARGFVEAVAAGMILTLIVIGGFWMAFDAFLPWQIGIGVVLVLFGALCWLRRSLWKQAALRVTNDRILIQEPGPFSLKSMKTVKWSQYQESATKKGGLLEMAFGVKHLIVRYGTADAQRSATFPGLPFATDIKHFLDKVDSAVRDGKAAELKTFVAKPRGKRDAPEETA